jgi:hypothetical protein
MCGFVFDCVPGIKPGTSHMLKSPYTSELHPQSRNRFLNFHTKKGKEGIEGGRKERREGRKEQWCTYIILATGEVEVGGSQLPGQKQETLSEKETEAKRLGGVAQVVEHLLTT